VNPHPALRRAILFGTPLTLVILELFHPTVARDVTATLFPVADWWVVLHVAQLVLFALMGVAICLLTSGLQGAAAGVSRMGATVFVVFYGAGDALLGIATGLLAREAGGLPNEVRGLRAEAVAVLFQDPTAMALYFIGELGWLTALVAAAVALSADSPRVPLVLLALSGCLLLVFDHPAPYGPVVFGSFLLSALWLELVRSDDSAATQHRNAGMRHP